MNKMPACYVFLGLLIGALFGAGIGALNAKAVHGMQFGAISSIFIGWIRKALAFQ